MLDAVRVKPGRPLPTSVAFESITGPIVFYGNMYINVTELKNRAKVTTVIDTHTGQIEHRRIHIRKDRASSPRKVDVVGEVVSYTSPDQLDSSFHQMRIIDLAPAAEKVAEYDRIRRDWMNKISQDFGLPIDDIKHITDQRSAVEEVTREIKQGRSSRYHIRAFTRSDNDGTMYLDKKARETRFEHGW